MEEQQNRCIQSKISEYHPHLWTWLNSVMVADAYAHRKQVNVKQLYNQVPQMAWVSSSSSCSWREDDSGVRASSRPRAWAFSDPRFSNLARMRNEYCYGQKNLGSISSSLSPSSTHLYNSTNITPFENTMLEVYFYKEVCSFVHWSRHYCWLCFCL